MLGNKLNKEPRPCNVCKSFKIQSYVVTGLRFNIFSHLGQVLVLQI